MTHDAANAARARARTAKRKANRAAAAAVALSREVARAASLGVALPALPVGLASSAVRGAIRHLVTPELAWRIAHAVVTRALDTSDPRQLDAYREVAIACEGLPVARHEAVSSHQRVVVHLGAGDPQQDARDLGLVVDAPAPSAWGAMVTAAAAALGPRDATGAPPPPPADAGPTAGPEKAHSGPTPGPCAP